MSLDFGMFVLPMVNKISESGGWSGGAMVLG